jgi:hypothetical protein
LELAKIILKFSKAFLIVSFVCELIQNIKARDIREN